MHKIILSVASAAALLSFASFDAQAAGGCGRCASRPVRRLPAERRGCRAGPGGGCARGLRAWTSLAPPSAPLLGLVTPP